MTLQFGTEEDMRYIHVFRVFFVKLIILLFLITIPGLKGNEAIFNTQQKLNFHFYFIDEILFCERCEKTICRMYNTTFLPIAFPKKKNFDYFYRAQQC